MKLNKLKLSGTTYEIQDLSAQPLLSAGTGIQISGNVISCTGGGGGNPTVELTQAEYDALVSAGTVSQNTYYIITDAQEIDTTNYWTSAQTQSAITQATSGKQDTLISGTNIKTVNNESLLGSGNITIQGGGKAIEGGRGITVTTGETVDTVSFNLPISAGTGTHSIQGGSSSTESKGFASVALGNGCYARGQGQVALGQDSKTYGQYSQGNVAIGYNCTSNDTYGGVAIGHYINVGGGTVGEFGCGTYNKTNTGSTDADKTLFSVGNGVLSARHNAFEIRKNGDIYIVSGGTDIKLQDNLGGGTVDASLDSGSTNAVANSAITAAIDAKQDTLIAGSGITIDSANTISCTVEGGGIPTNIEQLIATSLVDLNGRKIDTSEVLERYKNYVTTDTVQDITAKKTIIGEQNLDFKQTSDTTKLGFTFRDSGGTEIGSLQLRPNTINGKTFLALQDYQGDTASTRAHEYVGFRHYDKRTSIKAAYNLATPLPEDAKFTFGLTTSYQNFYFPLGFKNGNTMIKTDSSGVTDFTSEFSGKVETSAITTSITSGSTDSQVPSAKAVYDQMGGLKIAKVTQAEYDALVSGGTVDANTLYVITNVV